MTWIHLQYTGVGARFISPSATHAHIVQLVQHVPDHWERYVMVNAIDATDEGRKNTVGDWLEAMAGHIWEYCEEIREIRRLYGV